MMNPSFNHGTEQDSSMKLDHLRLSFQELEEIIDLGIFVKTLEHTDNASFPKSPYFP